MINQEQLDTLSVGDYITFKCATRSHCRKATRKVTGFYFGFFKRIGVEVHYHGWSGFVVKPHEISDIN